MCPGSHSKPTSSKCLKLCTLFRTELALSKGTAKDLQQDGNTLSAVIGPLDAFPPLTAPGDFSGFIIRQIGAPHYSTATDLPYYGLFFHFQLLPALHHGNAISFSYKGFGCLYLGLSPR